MINEYFEYLLYGILSGLIYILSIFGCNLKAGNCHNLNCTIPFLFIKNGSIIINNYHIHHWLIFLFLLFITLFFQNNYIVLFIQGFSVVLIIHGLHYDDCFCFNELKRSIK